MKSDKEKLNCVQPNCNHGYFEQTQIKQENDNYFPTASAARIPATIRRLVNVAELKYFFASNLLFINSMFQIYIAFDSIVLVQPLLASVSTPSP